MKKVIISLACAMLMACGNQNEVKVPEQVNVSVAPVTGEVIVKHVFSIELPTVFTDTCKAQHPNDPVAYNACVAKYIEELIKILNSINPNELPVVP